MPSLPRRLVVATTGLSLSGLALTGVGPTAVAQADEASVSAGIVSPAPSGVVRGTQAHIKVLQMMGSSDGCSTYMSSELRLDGHPFDDNTFYGDTSIGDANTTLTNPPGLPAGQYGILDYAWDTTSVATGVHTLTYAYTVDPCAAQEYEQEVSETIAVNNAPIGLVFSDRPYAVVRGSDHVLTVTAQPEGSPIKSVSFSGTLVSPAQALDYAAPYTSDLDILDAHNGLQTVVVTATDTAGVVTKASETLRVANGSKLTLSGPKRVNFVDDLTLKVSSNIRFRTGQKLILQQKAGGAWRNVQNVTLGSSGKATVVGGFRTPGRKFMRLVTASSTFWPGTSNIISMVAE